MLVVTNIIVFLFFFQVSQQVNHAKSMFIEQQQTLLMSSDNLMED